MRRLFMIAGLLSISWATVGELTGRIEPAYATRLLAVGAFLLALGYVILIEERRARDCRKDNSRPANDR